MSELSEQDLVKMLQSSDQVLRRKGFSVIYQEYFPLVRSFIEKNQGTLEDARDTFQDGVIAVYEQVINGTFKGESTIKTFLFAICKKIWWKRLGKASTRYEVFGKDTDFRLEEELVVDTMIANEKSKKLADLLSQLGKDCQKILLLFYYERKSMSEIAEAMQLASADVSKNKKNRCLNKLRKISGPTIQF